jgi:hypothetical protein
VTIERLSRRSSRSAFELVDRLRLEVVYTGGSELYTWAGSGAFERTIEELLPAHGMVTDGSFALHMRTLFLRNVAQFDEPKRAAGRVELEFSVPAVRSGYAMGTPAGSVPAGLEGTVWLDAATLDLERLQVRVETRLGRSVETTTYARVKVGEVEFVAPVSSELTMLPGGGEQLRNVSRFDEYHRFAGVSTLRFPGADRVYASDPAQQPARAATASKEIPATLESAIAADAAIGDSFVAIAGDGTRMTGRISDMRRLGKDQWNIELTLMDKRVRKTVRLPLAMGTRLVWR